MYQQQYALDQFNPTQLNLLKIQAPALSQRTQPSNILSKASIDAGSAILKELQGE